MKKLDPQFKIRLGEDLKRRLEGAAQESNRSLTSEIVHRLEESFLMEKQLGALEGEIRALAETEQENAKKLSQLPWIELRKSIDELVATREREQGLIRGLSTGILSIATARERGLQPTHRALIEAQEKLENVAKQLIDFGNSEQTIEQRRDSSETGRRETGLDATQKSFRPHGRRKKGGAS